MLYIKKEYSTEISNRNLHFFVNLYLCLFFRENILISGDLVKLADLGSCRGMFGEHPYTEYISTRWYRSPECLMTDGYYDQKVKIPLITLLANSSFRWIYGEQGVSCLKF